MNSRRAMAGARLFAMVMITVLVALIAPARAQAEVSVADPRVVADSSMTSGQVTTWDCVWLGSYPQTYVDDAATIAALDAATGWDASGDLVYDGVAYHRLQKSDATYSSSWRACWDWSSKASDAGWCYFCWEPVKWRVLETDGATALVVADVVLDDQMCNQTDEIVTWADCTLRSWLNGEFWDDCLTTAQQGAVVEQVLVNADSISYGTDGGADTTDKVFLLAESDVWYGSDATRHGFVTAEDTFDEARLCQASDYAQAMGTYIETSADDRGICWWWLRSPGYRIHESSNVTCVGVFGSVSCHGGGVTLLDGGIRPALRVSLSSIQVSYAGTVSSKGDVNEQSSSGSAGTSVEDATVTIADQTYTGEALEPEVSVTLGDKTLVAGTDYTLVYEDNVSAGTATVTISGCGDYEGTATATFTIAKAASSISLAAQTKTYTGKALGYSGKVTSAGSSGKVTYAYYSDAKCTTAVKAADVKNAGTYYVRATVAADANHRKATSAAAKFTIAKASSTIKLAAQTKTYTGKALAYGGKVTRTGSTGKVTYAYYSDAKCTKAVKAANVIKAGTYYVRGTVAANGNYKAATSAAVKFTVAKAKNPVTVTGKTATVKYSAVKAKAQALGVSKVATIAKAQGTKTYKVTEWTTAKAKTYISVNAKTGKVTVKKGTPKGTYKFKLRVSAAGNANYKAGSRTVTVKIVVK